VAVSGRKVAVNCLNVAVKNQSWKIAVLPFKTAVMVKNKKKMFKYFNNF